MDEVGWGDDEWRGAHGWTRLDGVMMSGEEHTGGRHSMKSVKGSSKYMMTNRAREDRGRRTTPRSNARVECKTCDNGVSARVTSKLPCVHNVLDVRAFAVWWVVVLQSRRQQAPSGGC